jgi:branched-chain amino acid transport system substrate-binding protein
MVGDRPVAERVFRQAELWYNRGNLTRGGGIMKSRTIRRQGLWVLAIVLTALLVVTSCAPGPAAPPTEGNVVEIGALPVLTGGGGSADQPAFRGFLDYVRYFNEEKGIPGVTLEVLWRDSATDVNRFLSGYRVLVDRGVPVIWSDLTIAYGGLGAILEKDQIPFLAGGPTATAVYPPGWMFGAWATDGEAGAVVLDYFRENWGEDRPPRLQLFVSETTFGREPAAEMTKYAESTGFEVLPLEISPLVVIDASTQLIRIQERGADLVYIQNIFTAGGPIMRDVERLGLQDKMQFGGTGMVMGGHIIRMAPVGAEGFLAARGLPWIDETDIPGVKTMLDMEMEYHGEVYDAPEYQSGWFYAAIVCEAVKRAVEDVGYENLDGAAVKRAFENMKDFNAAGMAKITYGPEDRRGCETFAVYQVQGGKIVRVSDYEEVPILVP